MKKFHSTLIVALAALVMTEGGFTNSTIAEAQPTIVEQPIKAVEYVTFVRQPVVEEETEVEIITDPAPAPIYEPSYLKKMGVVYWEEYKFTWYSEKVLPGGGLKIPGRHVDENGYVCDKDNFICVAAGFLPKGTIVDTPFGKQGKVYDYCATEGTIDIYTSW